MSSNSEKSPSLFENIVLSSLTGGLTMIITNPLDTLRIRWQVTPRKSGDSIFRFARTVLKTDGLLNGLWFPAIQTNAALCSITVGVRLGLYPTIRDRLTEISGSKSSKVMFASGLLSGACGYFVGNPLYMIKNQLQGEAGKLSSDGIYLSGARKGLPPSYKNGAQGLRKVFKADGIRGLWNGSSVLVMRGATLSSSQLMGYDTTKSFCTDNKLLEDGPALQFIASLIGGLTLVAFTMPFDVVLTRYQTSKTLGRAYKSPVHCVVQMWQQEGALVFYRGWTALLVRMYPSTLITFMIYENLRHALGFGFMD